MTWPTRNLTIGIVIVAALVAFVPGLLALSNCMVLRGEVIDWFVPVDAESLVHFSDRIVIARYIDETVHETPDSPTAHADSRISVVDVFRGFGVVESLKGDFQSGDTAYVRWSEGYYRRDKNGDPEFVERPAVTLTPGETYVLFLTPYRGRRPSNLEPGIRVWKTRDGPGVARADSQGRLSFQTDWRYRAALKDMNLHAIDGSGAPFELTIDGVRSLVATGPDTAGQ